MSPACRGAASPHAICFRLTCAAYLLIVIGCTLPDVRVAPEADQRDGGTIRGQAATTTTTTPQATQQAAGRAAEARASGGSGPEPAVGSMAAGTTGSTAAVGGAGGVRADAAAGSASDDETLVDAGNISSNENTADAGTVDGAGGTPASTNMPRASQCEVANGGCDVDPMATCHEAESGNVVCTCPSGASGSGMGINGCLSDAPCGTFECDAETVRDPQHELVWQRRPPSKYPGCTALAPAGAQAGDHCVSDQAQSYCSQLELDGTGWRIPTQDEFRTIVDSTRENPAIDLNAFPDTKPERYWTSGLVFGGDGMPLYTYVDFKDGYASASPVSGGESYYLVRCVRELQ